MTLSTLASSGRLPAGVKVSRRFRSLNTPAPLIGVPPTAYVATPSLFDPVLEETGNAEAKEERANEAAQAAEATALHAVLDTLDKRPGRAYPGLTAGWGGTVKNLAASYEI